MRAVVHRLRVRLGSWLLGAGVVERLASDAAARQLRARHLREAAPLLRAVLPGLERQGLAAEAARVRRLIDGGQTESEEERP